MLTSLLLTSLLFSCNKVQHILSFLFLSYLMLLIEITHTLSNLDDRFCGLGNKKKKSKLEKEKCSFLPSKSMFFGAVRVCVCVCRSVTGLI